MPYVLRSTTLLLITLDSKDRARMMYLFLRRNRNIEYLITEYYQETLTILVLYIANRIQVCSIN